MTLDQQKLAKILDFISDQETKFPGNPVYKEARLALQAHFWKRKICVDIDGERYKLTWVKQ